MRLLYVLVLLAAVWSTSARGVNLFFIEGDAFFHALLTEDSFESWDEGDFTLEYADTTPMMAAGCGSAGSMKLRVAGETESVRAKLKSLYNALREAYPKKLVVHQDGGTSELNGFHLFVYNRDLDFANRELRLAIKYNEEWVERFKKEYSLWSGEVGSFSSKKRPASDYYTDYETFVDSTEAVIHDWKMGPWVAPLKLQKNQGEKPAARAAVDLPDVQFVIVPRKNLKPYFNLRPKRNFYAVTDESIAVYRLTKEGVDCERLDTLESVKWMEWGEE